MLTIVPDPGPGRPELAPAASGLPGPVMSLGLMPRAGGGPALRRPAARGSRARSRLALGIAGAGLGMIPWLAYLAVSLPASPTARHWPAAWVGLDAMEAAGLVSTGVLLLRRDARACLAAAAAAALLLADAWFDVTTAPPGSGALTALLMAVLAELPAAALCAALAIRGLRRPDGCASAGSEPAVAVGCQPAPRSSHDRNDRRCRRGQAGRPRRRDRAPHRGAHGADRDRRTSDDLTAAFARHGGAGRLAVLAPGASLTR